MNIWCWWVYYDVHTFCREVGGLNTELISNTRKIKMAIRKQALIKLFTHCKRKRPVYGTLCDLGIEAFHCWKCRNNVEKSILDLLNLSAMWKIPKRIFKTFLHDLYYSLFQLFRKDIPRHHYFLKYEWFATCKNQ